VRPPTILLVATVLSTLLATSAPLASAGTFGVDADDGEVVTVRGESTSLGVSVRSYSGYDDWVALSIAENYLENGLTLSLTVDNENAPYSCALSIAAAVGADLGRYPLTLEGIGGDGSTDFEEIDIYVSGFEVEVRGGLENNRLVIERGRGDGIEVSVRGLFRYGRSVDIHVLDLPEGVDATPYTAGGVPPIDSLVWISADDNAVLGEHQVAIAGQGPSRTVTAEFILEILKAASGSVPELIAGRVNLIPVEYGEVSGVNVWVSENVSVGDGTDTCVEVAIDKYGPGENELPSAKVVYTCDNIALRGVSGEVIENLTVDFKVDKRWIANHDINRESIGVLRYSAGEWVPLETETTGESGTDVIYSATTHQPGGVFAVVGEVNAGGPPWIVVIGALLAACAAGAIGLLYYLRWRRG